MSLIKIELTGIIENMDKKERIKIVILAAGKGTRMKSELPKALEPLKGKPFIWHILDTVKKLDAEIKPVIVIGHKKEIIKQALGKGHVYAEQNEQLGTGHAVMSAQKAMQKEHEIVLVISVDQPMISPKTLELIISTQNKKKPTITLGVVVVPDFKEWRTGLNDFGRIVRGTNGLIKKIVEFKDASDKEKKKRELNLALYAFDAKWLWANIDKIKNKNAQAEYYLTDLVKIACKQNKKIETVQIANVIEALQPNSKEE